MIRGAEHHIRVPVIVVDAVAECVPGRIAGLGVDDVGQNALHGVGGGLLPDGFVDLRAVQEVPFHLRVAAAVVVAAVGVEQGIRPTDLVPVIVGVIDIDVADLFRGQPGCRIVLVGEKDHGIMRDRDEFELDALFLSQCEDVAWPDRPRQTAYRPRR